MHHDVYLVSNYSHYAVPLTWCTVYCTVLFRRGPMCVVAWETGLLLPALARPARARLPLPTPHRTMSHEPARKVSAESSGSGRSKKRSTISVKESDLLMKVRY